jgi:hypothetical protein
MDCVALAILVNESKYRPLIACLLNQFLFFVVAVNMIYNEI